jgi:hypothetical protein
MGRGNSRLLRRKGKAMDLTIKINDQVLSKIVAEVVKALVSSVPSAPQQNQQVEALQKQVVSLQEEITHLLAQPKATVSVPLAKPSAPQSIGPAAQAKPCEAQSQVKPCETQRQAKPNGNGNGKYSSPDIQKAEQWAHEHIVEWISQPCPFAKANGRSWKELAENIGEKIVINGKASQPRAYLHVLEGWNDCNGWAKTKAKVALEVIPSKNGNGSKA